jgi:gliding motility-associated-like protein
MFKRRFIVILLSFIFQQSFGQQNNIWYFGKRAGLNFNASTPVVLHNSIMDADEGSASICDNSGNLLFYTNGVTVYNRNHQVMLNGSGLLGNLSAVQSAIIIPMPGTVSRYYIFTTDAIENNFANGYNYSIVDMSRDNGKGEVVVKNVLLSASCTERMAAVRHADGLSVWLLTNERNSNVFKAWLVGCNGIQATAVTSAAGVVLNGYELMNTGMMKASPDGKQLCQTHFPFFDEGVVNANFFQLFDFDNLTGDISNARTITPPNVQITSCEYSSNSKLLYLSRPYDKAIDQVEATLATPAAIVASRISISTGNATFYGIQLAPDQKIYLSQPANFLGAINNPNVKGSGCNFQKEQIDVNGSTGSIAYAGLPSFVNDLSFDGNNGFSYTIVDSCVGTVQFNGVSTIPGTLTWDWNFGDGFTSSLQNLVHTFSPASQQYTVSLKIQASGGCGVLERSKEVIPKGLILNAGFDFLSICDSGYIRFINTTTFSPDTALIKYAWDFGDGNTSTLPSPIHSFPSSAFFNVRLTVNTTTACLDQSLSKPVNLELLDIQASPDQVIDEGQMVQINATGNGATRYTWTPRTGLSNSAIANPVAKPRRSTMYVITAYNQAGCKDLDSVFIKVNPIPGINVPSGFTPNNDGKNDVIRPIIADEYVLQEFSIYNRWGQKIFSTKEKDTGWNGKIKGVIQDSGVYVWIVNAVDTVSGIKEEKKGTLVLIR